MAIRTKGTGRIPFVDPRNMDYLLADRAPGLYARAASLTKPRTVRNWMLRTWLDQSVKPFCTAYGSLHELYCGPIYHKKKPIIDPDHLFALIQSEDRRHGRVYTEGATTNAACAVMVQLGFWGGYDWDYEGPSALGALMSEYPIIAGTAWTDSMFDRDREGIIRVTSWNLASAGGHLYCVNGINLKRGLVRIANTWGDGYYWLPIEDFLRLVREGGETVLPRELPF